MTTHTGVNAYRVVEKFAAELGRRARAARRAVSSVSQSIAGKRTFFI